MSPLTLLPGLFVILPLVSFIPPDAKIVYAIRNYQRAGPSHVELMEMNPTDMRSSASTEGKADCVKTIEPSVENKSLAQKIVGDHGGHLTWSEDGTMFAFVDRNPSVPPPSPNPWGCPDIQFCFFPDLKIIAADGRPLATIRLPEFGEHWNYPVGISWSPDGQTLLVGGEAGSSDSHFADYWLVDWKTETWRYAGGGNNATWSPDGSRIVWTTPRTLESIGNLHVWVTHLEMLDVRSLRRQLLTSGTSIISDFFWCSK